MSLSVLKCPESSLNISPFFPLPLPICHHSPQCQNCMLPSNLTLRESHLFLQFPPLSSILGALAFLSALPKIMLLWYVMLTKLFSLPPQSQVTFFLLPFVFFISQTPLLPWLLLHLSSLYCLPSALSLPQKQQEARLLMIHPLINLRCVPLAHFSWYDCCPWQR